MAWAAIIPVAIAAMQELMKQPQQGQLANTKQPASYTPTASQFGQQTADQSRLQDVGGGFGPNGLQQPSKPSQPSSTPAQPSNAIGNSTITGTLGPTANNAQTAQALGAGGANQKPDSPPSSSGNAGQYAQLAMQLGQMLQGGGAQGGGLMHGNGSAYSPTALRLQQLFGQQSPYPGYRGY